jgi:DivIVA domain-containing protein
MRQPLPVTATQALHTPFRLRLWKAGYDPDQVDDFLDQAALSLAAVEAGTAPTMTMHDVFDATFLETRFVTGYDQDDVDDFLDRVADTFREAQP